MTSNHEDVNVNSMMLRECADAALDIFSSISDDLLEHVASFLTSRDLVNLITTNSFWHHLLTESASNIIWKYPLQNDFGFSFHDTCRTSFSLETLRIHSQHKTRNQSNGYSIFGYHFSDESSTCTVRSAYVAWKSWKDVSDLFYSLDLPNDFEVLDYLEDVEPDCEDDDIVEVDSRFVNGPFFLRAAKVWYSIALWADHNGRFGKSLKASFANGVRHYNGRFGKCKYSQNIIAVEAIFAFCDGQMTSQCSTINALDLTNGFFGYYIYDGPRENNMRRQVYCQNCRLFSTRDAIDVSLSDEWVLKDGNEGTINHHLVLTRTPNSNAPRTVFVNYLNGKLRALYRQSIFHPVYNDDTIGEEKNDQSLRYIEDYINSLSNGVLVVEDDRYISPFATFPVHSELVKVEQELELPKRIVERGIEIIISTTVGFETNSIIVNARIRILTEGEDGYLSAERRGFLECKLCSNAWFPEAGAIRRGRRNIPHVYHIERLPAKRCPILFENGYRFSNVRKEASYNLHFAFVVEQEQEKVQGSIEFLGTESFVINIDPFDVSLFPRVLY